MDILILLAIQENIFMYQVNNYTMCTYNLFN